MKFFVSLALLVSISAAAFAVSDPMVEFWKAVENNDFETARSILEDAREKPETREDATVALMLLNSHERKYVNRALTESIYNELENPSAFLHAMWFNHGVCKDYNKKEPSHLAFLKRIAGDPRVNTSVKANLNYLLSLHYVYSNDDVTASATKANVGAIKKWAYVGPFDNTSGSGFNKSYGPISKADEETIFKSSTNSDIHWYSPQLHPTDPWMTPQGYIPGGTAVMYAQSFVTNPTEQEAIVAVGFTGSMKVWVNDNLVIEQERNQRTALDVKRAKITLPAGTNRVLVQLGYTSENSYPSFAVRLLDTEGYHLKNLTYSTTLKEYNTGKLTATAIPHFAEEYYKQKVEADPYNPLYCILLSRVYGRKNMNNEAIEVIRKCSEKHANNIFLERALFLNLSALGDRTKILEQIEIMRNVSPECIDVLEYDLSTAINNRTHDEAAELLDDYGMKVGYKSPAYFNKQIQHLAAKEDYERLIEAMLEAYNEHPENSGFLQGKFRILQAQNASSSQGVKLLESYSRKTYDYDVLKVLAETYEEQGKTSKLAKLLKKNAVRFPYDQNVVLKLVQYYYTTRNFYEAERQIDVLLENAPFDASLWYSRANVQYAMRKPTTAIKNLKTAIHHNPNLFAARELKRELEGKEPLMTHFRNEDLYDEIKEFQKRPMDNEENFEYICNNVDYAVLSGGASMQLTTVAVRVLTEAGVDEWKQANISVGRYQNFTVEKAEVVKPAGQKIVGERSYNELIFPSLEVGDVVLFQVRFENYTGGSLGDEFWLNHTFNDYVPIHQSRLRVLVPMATDLKIKSTNIDIEPEEYKFDEFDAYVWEFKDLQKVKYESYMPRFEESGMNIKLSTLDNWSEVSTWYSELAMPQAMEDYNLQTAYNEIFDGRELPTERDKAEAIYDYLCDNIHYIHVPFRQSSYVPQKPMQTVSTQLGDCKDLSTLYYALAKKAGLQTHLVLVLTRDNGVDNLKLPTIDFNHCIIKIDLPEGELYQELTDSQLPFGSMPNTVAHAQALIIPNTQDSSMGKNLIKIPAPVNAHNGYHRTSSITINGMSTRVNSKLNTYGTTTSRFKSSFDGQTTEECEEIIQSWLADYFENSLKLDTFELEGLDEKTGVFTVDATFDVENEIKTIGKMHAIKVPFFEKLFSLDKFPDEERNFDLEYWDYESDNSFVAETTVILPQGAVLEDLPDGFNYENDFIKYQLTVEALGNNSILVKRKADINNRTVKATEYEAFRDGIVAILKAEDLYLAYKVSQ